MKKTGIPMLGLLLLVTGASCRTGKNGIYPVSGTSGDEKGHYIFTCKHCGLVMEVKNLDEKCRVCKCGKMAYECKER